LEIRRPHGLSEPLCDQITIRRYRAIASLRATGRCAGTTAVRASADRSADERAYVLFGSEDKVRIAPKKRRRLDQLQSFQTGVTLLADDDVALDRNTELLRDLNNHSRHLDVSTRWCWVSSRMIVHQHDRTAWCPLGVIFDGFNGGCRQVNVRFYPVSAEPGPGQKRFAWTDPRDSNSQTGGRIMRYELADYEWLAIKPMLPNKPRGVPRVNDRRVLNGIFWVLRSGAPWRDLPDHFGPYTTFYNRFVRWRRAGVWGRIIDAFAAAHDVAVQMIDTSIVRVHQHGACITRNQRQSMGRSRGGLTSKIHAVVDSNGLPVRLALSPGEAHDVRLAGK